MNSYNIQQRVSRVLLINLPLKRKWGRQTSMSIDNLNNIQNFSPYFAENIVRIRIENILLMPCGVVIGIGYEYQMKSHKTLCGKMPLHITALSGSSNFSVVQYHLLSFKYHFDVGGGHQNYLCISCLSQNCSRAVSMVSHKVLNFTNVTIRVSYITFDRSRSSRRLRCGSAAARLLGLRVRIQPGAWTSVFWVLCVVRFCSPRRADHSSRGDLQSVIAKPR
jgi:hypothetical protein